MENYNIKDLAVRYGCSQQYLTRVIRDCLPMLNEGDAECKKIGQKWHINSAAVAVLDEKFFDGVTSADVVAEDTRIRALTDQVETLHTQVALLTNELNKHKDRIILLLDEKTQQTQLLNAAEVDKAKQEVQITDLTAKMADLTQTVEVIKEDRQAVQDKLTTAENELQALHKQIQEEKARSFFRKLFDLFTGKA